MRLYRFFTAAHGLDALQKRRLRLSRIEELNDEFEMTGIKLEQPEVRDALRETRREMHETVGVLCMSEVWNSPLLWAHYAAQGTGLVLGFDVSVEHFRPVNYVRYPISLPNPNISEIEQIDELTMQDIIHAKYEAWSFEREWRAYFKLAEHELIGTALHYFHGFKGLKLAEVIAGSRYKGPLGDLVRLSKLPDHAVSRVFPEFGRFDYSRRPAAA